MKHRTFALLAAGLLLGTAAIANADVKTGAAQPPAPVTASSPAPDGGAPAPNPSATATP